MSTSPAELKTALQGVIAFAPTLFTMDDEIDAEALREHVGRLSESGACAIVVCGGVAEFFALTPEEHAAVFQAAVEGAAGRVPVIAGTGYSTRIATSLAHVAAERGVDGIMVNPSYFVQPPPRGWLSHYKSVATAGLGIIVFSTPQCKHTVATVRPLCEIDEVIGFKDEYGDIDEFQKLREALDDRLAWINGMAETHVLQYAAVGAQAMTSGLVNFAPELVLRLWQDASDGLTDSVLETIKTYIRPLSALRQRHPGYHISVIKEAMQFLGYGSAQMRGPLCRMTDAERAELISILHEISSAGYLTWTDRRLERA